MGCAAHLRCPPHPSAWVWSISIGFISIGRIYFNRKECCSRNIFNEKKKVHFYVVGEGFEVGDSELLGICRPVVTILFQVH